MEPVLSDELLSTTIISPFLGIDRMARFRLDRVLGKRASSLYAGMITEYAVLPGIGGRTL
jgi:hypothetical protein